MQTAKDNLIASHSALEEGSQNLSSNDYRRRSMDLQSQFNRVEIEVPHQLRESLTRDYVFKEMPQYQNNAQESIISASY
jgi:hypothetical protein